MSDLAEDHFCLLVFTAALDGPTVTAASNHPRDEKHIADAQRIGPSARWRFRNMRAGNSFDLHAFILFCVISGSRPTSANHPVQPSRSIRSASLNGVCDAAITSSARGCTCSTCVFFGP